MHIPAGLPSRITWSTVSDFRLKVDFTFGWVGIPPEDAFTPVLNHFGAALCLIE